MQLLLFVSPKQVPGWQGIEGGGKLCNHQVVGNKNNIDAVNVNALDCKDHYSTGIYVNLTTEDNDLANTLYYFYILSV